MKFLLNPYVLIAIGAALVGVGIWQHHAGVVAERVGWQQHQAEEERRYAAKIDELTAINRENERARAEDQAAAEAKFLKEKEDADLEHRRVVDALRAGNLRLRDKYATAVASCGSAEGAAAPGAGVGDGEAGTELSVEASRFLLDLTHEADDVTRQLGACQVILAQCQKENPR